MPFFYGFPTIMLNGKEGFNKFFIIYLAHKYSSQSLVFYVEIKVDQTNLQMIYKAIKQKMQEKIKYQCRTHILNSDIKQSKALSISIVTKIENKFLIQIKKSQNLKCIFVPQHILSFLKIFFIFSHSVMSDSLQPHGLQPTRLHCPQNFPGKNTGVGCHFLHV